MSGGATIHEREKVLVRRTDRDRSQMVRHSVQGAFVVLNGWLGVQFCLWVRYFESGGHTLRVARPAGVEGWLPIAGLMNLKLFVMTGRVPAVHPAAMFLLVAFAVMSLLLKKSFCAWLCPVGTLSEFLWNAGRKLVGRNLRLPRWIDLPLRGLKYVLLSFFVLVIGFMSVEALEGFLATPYGLIADVKMLNFFRTMGTTAALVLVVLVAGSLLVKNFWCRYGCPYGALLGLVSLVSPVKIRRDGEACIECGKCAKACPAGLEVDRLTQVRSAECTACMACVAACPAQNALQLALPPAGSGQRWRGRVLRPVVVVVLLAYVFAGAVLVARATNHWRTDVPEAVYMELVPHAREMAHPGL